MNRDKEKVSVLSYNIHKGFNLGNRKHVLNSIRNAIREVHADLVFLQEVLGEHTGHQERVEDWPDVSQFEFLADEVWPHYAYGQNAVYSQGHHGNAILSKYPITAWENIDISVSAFARRGLLHAKIGIPDTNQTLHAICLHLDLLKAGRDTQTHLLAKRIQESIPEEEPIVIAGDFNDWSVAATKKLEHTLHLKEVFKEATGKHARTFPAQAPALKLDRIYTRGLGIERAVRLSGEPWNELSDHLALYAEIKLPHARVKAELKKGT